MIQEFLSQTHSHKIYDFNSFIFNNEVQHICNVLQYIQHWSVKHDDSLLITDFAMNSVNYYCERLYEQFYLNDRKYLFLSYIYDSAQMRER